VPKTEYLYEHVPLLDDPLSQDHHSVPRRRVDTGYKKSSKEAGICPRKAPGFYYEGTGHQYGTFWKDFGLPKFDSDRG
jgi:hypothetical protein